MNSLLRFYLWRVIAPMLAVVTGSVIVLLAVLWWISVIECRRGRPSVFELDVPALGDAPLAVLLLAGLVFVQGVALIRFWSLVTAEVGRTASGKGFELNVPIPIGRVLGISCMYIGGAVFAFYAMRSALW